MTSARHLTTEQLEQGLEHILQSPKDGGELALIVKRPEVDRRESVSNGRLDTEQGLIGETNRRFRLRARQCA